MKEKVLLVHPGYKNREIVYFPLGLGYLAGACEREGIEVACLDVNASHLGWVDVLRAVQVGGFHVVGIGGFVTQLRASIQLANLIKRHCKGVTVVLGGLQVVGCEDFIMANSEVDVICTGEGETVLPELVHALHRGTDLAQLSSIIFRRGHDIVKRDWPGPS